MAVRGSRQRHRRVKSVLSRRADDMKRALRCVLRSTSPEALCGVRQSAPCVSNFARSNPATSRSSAKRGVQLRFCCSQQHSHSSSSAAAHRCLLLEEGCSSNRHFWAPAAWSSWDGGGGERERSFGRLRAAVAAAVAAVAAVTAAVAVDSAGGRGAKCEYAEGTKFTDVYYLAANAPPLGVGESWVDNHGCLGSAVLVVCCLVWWSVLLADGDGERDSWRCFSREMDDARQNTGTWSILLLVHTTQKLHRAKSWRACSCDRFLFCIPSTLLRRARVLCDVPSM